MIPYPRHSLFFALAFGSAICPVLRADPITILASPAGQVQSRVGGYSTPAVSSNTPVTGLPQSGITFAAVGDSSAQTAYDFRTDAHGAAFSLSSSMKSDPTIRGSNGGEAGGIEFLVGAADLTFTLTGKFTGTLLPSDDFGQYVALQVPGTPPIVVQQSTFSNNPHYAEIFGKPPFETSAAYTHDGTYDFEFTYTGVLKAGSLVDLSVTEAFGPDVLDGFSNFDGTGDWSLILSDGTQPPPEVPDTQSTLCLLLPAAFMLVFGARYSSKLRAIATLPA